jgi:hypothetical protein
LGGIFDRATTAVIGEAGPEVVIPLTNPRRALELFEQSGLAEIISRARRDRASNRMSVPTAGGGQTNIFHQTFNEKVNPQLLSAEIAWRIA